MDWYPNRNIPIDVGRLEIHPGCRSLRAEQMGSCKVDTKGQPRGSRCNCGSSRNRWDGVVVAEYLKRSHSIKIHVRHAQRIIRKLGYTLRRPSYQYVQATDEGVAEFQDELKKTPSRPRKRR